MACPFIFPHSLSLHTFALAVKKYNTLLQLSSLNFYQLWIPCSSLQASLLQFQSFLKKMGQPRPLFHLFSSFQTHITNLTANRYVKKCPSSIWCRDSNSQTFEHESLPIPLDQGSCPTGSISLRDCTYKKLQKCDKIIKLQSHLLTTRRY